MGSSKKGTDEQKKKVDPAIVDIPQNVAEMLAQVATDAVAAAEGGWGAKELEWALQGIAESITGLCSEYDVEYEVYDDTKEDSYRNTTEPYIAPSD